MTFEERLRHWSRLGVHLGNNPLSLLGAALTTGAAVTLLWFWILEITSPRSVHPYIGVLLFLILPAVFLLGLLLIPVGLRRQRQKLYREGHLPTAYPKVDFHAPVVRNALLVLGGATVVNVALMGTATYKGVEYMESNQFCGLTCHTVMAPEYAAFVDSAHSRVGCVQCPIGPGAGWYVRSKLSGLRQVFAVALGTYSRPIPSPVHHLRPAQETCEQCHWPQKFVGDKFLIKRKYADDEPNTPLYTVLALKVGGRSGQHAAGIHGAHLGETGRITYVTTDGRRQIIPRVTRRDDKGELVEYVSEDVKVTPEELARGETRAMDCIDCHNRPTHAFELPERAVDRALSDGQMSRELPFIKKKGVELLRAEYPDHGTAERRIAQSLADYYKESYPEVYRSHRGQVEAAGGALFAIYKRNIFPEMRVTWGTHPNHVGHEDFPGCFRCHDESHKAKDGRTISQDCETCHALLAQEEKDPAILKQMGVPLTGG
ncbi:MAG TPA: cytochrome C [Vicinamibacteria bacterium]